MATTAGARRDDDEHIPLPRLVGAREIAQAFGLCPSSVYQLARAGELPCVRLRSSVRFDPAAVAEWIRSQGAR